MICFANNNKKYDCKFLSRCNNKYCNFTHPHDWNPVKNYFNDWNGCYQINPSILPFALEFGIEIFKSTLYWKNLKDCTTTQEFNKVVTKFLKEKLTFLEKLDSDSDCDTLSSDYKDVLHNQNIKDILSSGENIEKWCDKIRWAMVIEMKILDDSKGIVWLHTPSSYVSKKYRSASSYFYVNKNNIKSNICKNGENGFRCYKAMCMCIHKPGHNFREAYEKFYDKIYKNNFIEEDYVEDKKLNIPQGFEFVYKKEFGFYENQLDKRPEMNLDEKIYKGMFKALDVYNNFSNKSLFDFENLECEETIENLELSNLIRNYNNLKETCIKQYFEFENTNNILKKIKQNIDLVSESLKKDEVEKSIIDVSKLF